MGRPPDGLDSDGFVMVIQQIGRVNPGRRSETWVRLVADLRFSTDALNYSLRRLSMARDCDFIIPF